MKSWFRLLILISSASMATLSLGQAWNFVKIDPKSTYLRDSQFAPSAATIHLGLEHRDDWTLEIRTVGYYNRASDNRASRNISSEAVVVFSSTGKLDGDWHKQERVGGAVDAGTDFYTLPTWNGGLPTDIGEDFGIDHQAAKVDIPTGGDFFMVTPYDNGFWNNEDDFSLPGADSRGFGIEYRVIRGAVPEPATLATVAIGLIALARRRTLRTR